MEGEGSPRELRALLRAQKVYSRLVCDWVEGAGTDPDVYGTQSLRRTKVLLIVQTTGNLKAVQLLLGHTKIESTARYLETELKAALKISEKMEL